MATDGIFSVELDHLGAAFGNLPSFSQFIGHAPGATPTRIHSPLRPERDILSENRETLRVKWQEKVHPQAVCICQTCFGQPLLSGKRGTNWSGY